MTASNYKTMPYSYPRGMVHVLKFDSQIDEPEYYSHFCDVLMMATEDDIVEMYFSTPGGNGDTMIAIMNLMDMCKAHIHGVLASSASSAGSFLLLKCDSYTIGKHCNMLCHQTSYGVGGSHHEVRSLVSHIEQEERGLVEDVYADFLTKEEMERLMKGEQIYLRSEEIADRLEKREELRSTAACEAEAEAGRLIDEMFSPPSPDVLKKLTKPDLIKLITGEIGLNDDGKIVKLDENGEIVE